MRNRTSFRIVNESGAALVMVLVATVLLGTACIAMLTAVGASSANNTDALSEAKAYYAAESGLQASINVMRFNGVTYSTAVSSVDLAEGDAGIPTGAGLPYNGNGLVVIGDTSFKISLNDPDNTRAQTRYATVGSFRQPDGTYAATRVFTETVAGDPPTSKTTTFSFTGQAATTVSHPMSNSSPTPFGSLRIVNENGGATIAANQFPIKFRILYAVGGSGASRTFFGQIAQSGQVTFSTGNTYELGGSQIDLCSSSSSCPSSFSMTLPMASADAASPFYGFMTPMEPYRLAVRATGNGPNGATKQLEAVLQRNYFNNIGAAAAITMLGPGGSDFLFRPGSSSQMSIDGVAVPSIIVSDPTALGQVTGTLAGPPNRSANVLPAPEVAGDALPSWQESPQAMEEFLAPFITSAQNSDRIVSNNEVLDTGEFGDFAAGTGLTVCEANCTLRGDGGGVLIVRETLTFTGNPQFRGIIIVTGEGGVTRSGGGNKFTLHGNMVIAPYDPNNLSAGFVSPRYDVNGGPGDIEYSDDVDLEGLFNNTSGISNFILGIAEK